MVNVMYKVMHVYKDLTYEWIVTCQNSDLEIQLYKPGQGKQ